MKKSARVASVGEKPTEAASGLKVVTTHRYRSTARGQRMFRSLLVAAVLSTLSSNAFAGASDPVRTPSDILADRFRVECSSAGGKPVVGKDAIASTSSIREKLSNDLLVDGRRVLCRGASVWSIASGIYTDDARLIVSELPSKWWVWGQDKPRFVYDATGAECGGAGSCRI